MVACLGYVALCVTWISLSGGLSYRSDLLVLLDGLKDSPVPLESLIETMDAAREGTAASRNDRRRSVSDVDCDYITDRIDSIESSCHQYRYQQLVAVQPQFQQLLLRNNTENDKLVYLTKAIEGDSESTQVASGVLQNLLLQRIAIYGGTDPSSNTTEMGQLARFKQLFDSLAALHKSTSASLENLWRALVKTDKHVANQTQNQVFAYGTAVKRLLGLLSNTSQDALNYDVALMGETAHSLTQGMLGMVKQICETQQELVSLNSNASDTSGAVAPVLEAAVDMALQRFNEALSEFEDAQLKENDLIDSVNRKAEDVMDGGVDSVQRISQVQVSAFSKALALMLETFKKDTESTVSGSLGSLSADLGKKSSTLDQTIGEFQYRLVGVTKQLADQLGALKEELAGKLSTANSQIFGGIEDSETKLQDSKDLVSSTVSKNAQAIKGIDQQFSGASTTFDSQASDLRTRLSSVVSKAGTESTQLMMSSIRQAGETQQKISQLSSNGEGRLSVSLSSVGNGVGKDALSTGTTVGDQEHAVFESQQLGRAQLQASIDETSQVVDSSLAPLQGTVLDTASRALSLASTVRAAEKNAINDASAARESSNTAITSNLQASKVEGLASVSQGQEAMNGMLGSSTNSLFEADGQLIAATSIFEAQQRAAHVLLEQSQGIADGVEGKITKAGETLAAVAESTASLLKAKVENSLSDASQGVDSVVSRATEKIENIKRDSSEPLLSLTNALKTVGVTDPGLSQTDPQVRALVQILAQIQGDIAKESERKAALVDEFRNALAMSSQQGKSEIPGLLSQIEQEVARNAESFAETTRNEFSRKFKSLQAWADQENATWDDSSIADSAETALSALAVKVEALLDSLTSSTSSMSKEMSAVSSGTPALDATVSELASSGKAKIAKTESDLLHYINSTAESFARNMSVSPENLADLMQEVDENFQRSVGEGSDAAIKAEIDLGEVRLQSDSSQGEQDVVSSLQDTETKTANVVKKTVSGSVSDFVKRANTLSSTESTIQQAAALARAIVGEANRMKTGSSQSLEQEASEASYLLAKLNTAISAGNTSLYNELAQSDSQADYVQRSSAVQAAGLISGANLTVSDAMTALKQLQNAVDVSSNSEGDSVAGAKEQFTSLKLQLSKVIDESLAAIGTSKAKLTDRVTGESAASKFQLRKIRDFVKSVRNAWFTYSDYEKGKFGEMADNDAFVLKQMEGTALAGLTNGRQKIHDLNSTISNISESLQEDGSLLSAFLSDSAWGLGNVTENSNSLGTETAANQSSIENLIASTRKSMTTEDAVERAYIASNVSAFEASLASMSSQVLLASSFS